MIVRFGYVAMSVVVHNASPSRTMTAANFAKIADREAGIRKLERLAAENLRNTLRLLRHNRAHDIRVFRFSSRLIPLVNHPLVEGWDPYPALLEDFAAVGEYVRKHGMRVSFHPDHFTVLTTPRDDVLAASNRELRHQVRMLEAMGLDERTKCNIHIGGTYGDKLSALARFVGRFPELDGPVRRRLTLENDDKTYTARETLDVCEQVGAPMVLDIHHHQVNNGGESAAELWPRIRRTWPDGREPDGLPPKIHASSPKDGKDARAHADYVEAPALLAFLRAIAPETPRLDVMLEAKRKDDALFRLMDDLSNEPGVRVLDQASVEIMT